jgi:thioredoxin reductase (NADPH)
MSDPDRIENVVIVGSGPAGYTAALYTARADLEPLVFEGWNWGGLLQTTTEVENFPGFREGIQGPALMEEMRAQAERFGARLEAENVDELRLADEPGGIHEVVVGDQVHRARTVILAMGAEHKKLGVEGEEALANQGVSYCATCDAAFFKGHPIVVVGGGDSAFEEAIFLAKFGTEVHLVHRRDEFRASAIMVDRAREVPNLHLKTPYVVDAFLEGDGPYKRIARLKHVGTGETEDLPMGGAFVAVGHEPQSTIVRGQVDVDDEGYVRVEGRSTRTNRPGVFAAGDLVDHTYRQAITAAGSGCQAALDAEWYLRDTPQIPTPAPLEAVPSIAESQWGPTQQGT